MPVKDVVPTKERDLSKKLKKRPKRQRFNGPRDIITFANKDPNYHYRVVNDVKDRLKRFESAGYEFVTSDESLGDTGSGIATAPGTVVTRPVGDNVTGVLMRIKKEWYEEDQKVKQKEIDEREEGLRSLLKQDGHYGDISIKH